VVFSKNSALQPADYTGPVYLNNLECLQLYIQLGIANHHTFSDRKITFISTLHLSGQCTLLTTQHTSMEEQTWQLKETWTDVSFRLIPLWKVADLHFIRCGGTNFTE